MATRTQVEMVAPPLAITEPWLTTEASVPTTKAMRTVSLAAAEKERAATSAAAGSPAADAAPPQKVLRYAFRIAETGFDPPQLTDLYSRTLVASIFDSLYEWEFLARPVRMRPRTAAALPEVSSDFRTFTIRIRPGIWFADDPAFNGRRRELVAPQTVSG